MVVIINNAPVSERYWKKGDEATISNGQIRLGGCWFPFDERYETEPYVGPHKWENCPREDLSMIPTMASAGWLPEFAYKDKRHERITPDNVPHEGVSFYKGTIHAWKTYSQGSSQWMVADFIDGGYDNHRKYNTLYEVLAHEPRTEKTA